MTRDNQQYLESRARVDAWNRDHHTGRAVTVLRDNGETTKTFTRSEAYVCESGEAVIFLMGIRGFYLLDRIRPYHGTDETPDYQRAGGDCVCGGCDKPYFDHPLDFEHLGQHDIPFLVKLCDGRLVKL